MSLEVVYGKTRHRDVTNDLARALQTVVGDGTVYLGYPVLASADERVAVDAMLVSQEHGLVAFQIADDAGFENLDADEAWATQVEAQDRLYAVLESHLGRHDGLRKGRRLAFDIQTVTLFPSDVEGAPPSTDGGHYCSLSQAVELVERFDSVDEEVYKALQAALQRVTTIKPAKRRSSVRVPRSRGAVLKEIEKGIANLDRWQKRAAIGTPEGPQRIRGLAGSGKTIVLALKAAYLHAQQPEWRVVMTFQSRALYQQLEDLITRFSFEHSNDKPDFEKLQIIHAWGSGSRNGVYQVIANALGAPARDWNYAKTTYGMDDAFQGVCKELLTLSEERVVVPIFDAVLIDEAQDLPPEFFQLVYRFTKEPKRIIWGFDELQRLSETAMPTTDELFGRTGAGESRVTLDDRPGEAPRDIVLPVCYRNSPWTLATAHALGFGIYRPQGLAQHFDEPALWREIGYEEIHGSLDPGSSVSLRRREDSYPEYFTRLLNPTDAVILRGFDDELSQDAWVASEIAKNLSEDELEHDDILVVLPDAYTSKRRAARFARVLSQHDINSHLVGVSSSVDRVFVSDSVAIAHIYRAKGNEAPMVYVLDAHHAASRLNLLTRRNTLFTALTRSRAWVRITGWGDGMMQISQEVDAVRERDFKLEFSIPTSEQLAKMRRVHRDRTVTEAASLRRATKGLKDLVEAFDNGEIDADDLPAVLRARLRTALQEELNDEGE